MNKAENEYMLQQLKVWMRYNQSDDGKSIHVITKEYPMGFWDTWKEIKARKLEFKEKNQIYIGIVGTRSRDSYKDFNLLQKKWELFYNANKAKDIVIVSGLCSKGGDKFALFLYRNYATKKLWFPAQWDLYGTKAGIIRNTDIALVSEILIAMVKPDRKGGTEDTIIKFLSRQGHTKNLYLL